MLTTIEFEVEEARNEKINQLSVNRRDEAQLALIIHGLRKLGETTSKTKSYLINYFAVSFLHCSRELLVVGYNKSRVECRRRRRRFAIDSTVCSVSMETSQRRARKCRERNTGMVSKCRGRDDVKQLG